MTQVYDIIGDIHGVKEPVEKLLHKLGYVIVNGVYTHPQGHKVCFLGDFIDRGPEQQGVLELVRAMVDSGNAIAIMGNHEFNAICYATQLPDGSYVREHNAHNYKHHKAFLDEYPLGSEKHKEIINWFKTLPVYIDLPEFSAIHACWDDHYIKTLSKFTNADNTLKDQAYIDYACKTSEAHEVLECLLKGPEMPLPEGVSFETAGGVKRERARIKWWQANNSSVVDSLFLPVNEMEQAHLDKINALPLTKIFNGNAGRKPIFLGHYWLTQKPEPLTDTVACLDYSTIKTNVQVGYRFQGERKLKPQNFVY